MFVFSFKASTLKYIGVMSLCTMAVVLTVVFMPTQTLGTDISGEAIQVSSERKQGDFKNVKTTSDRVAFLKSYGWSVDKKTEVKTDVTIPEVFDTVYSEYNAMQKKEGLDLEKYKGKKVDMYTYEVTNAAEEAWATVLVYKNKVIGGDITAANPDSFSCGFGGE